MRGIFLFARAPSVQGPLEVESSNYISDQDEFPSCSHGLMNKEAISPMVPCSSHTCMNPPQISDTKDKTTLPSLLRNAPFGTRRPIGTKGLDSAALLCTTNPMLLSEHSNRKSSNCNRRIRKFLGSRTMTDPSRLLVGFCQLTEAKMKRK